MPETFPWPALPEEPIDLKASPVMQVLAEAVTPWGLAAVFRNLQFGGYAIPAHAEEETAAALYFMLGHALRHGDNWRRTVIEELRQIQARGTVAALQAAGFTPAEVNHG